MRVIKYLDTGFLRFTSDENLDVQDLNCVEIEIPDSYQINPGYRYDIAGDILVEHAYDFSLDEEKDYLSTAKDMLNSV